MTADVEPDQDESHRRSGDAALLPRTARRYLRLVRRHLGPGPYLDYRCGSGDLLRRLAEQGSASGFEPSPAAAERSRLGAPGCPVHTAHDDIPTGVFRGLVAVGALDALDEGGAREALDCWRRVLVPGGRALVVTPADRGRLLVDAGFTVLREGPERVVRVRPVARGTVRSSVFVVGAPGA